MQEFLIRRTDGEWFDLSKDQNAAVLKPKSFKSKPIPGWGDHRIVVEGCEISFSYEDPGIQICFEGSTISDSIARQIVEEIRENIQSATGQSGRVVEI